MEIGIAFDKNPLPLPYVPINHEGHVRYEYIDLREEPERIDELPELKDAPELREAIKTLNGPESVFRTLGCEKAASDFPHPTLKRKFVSYFDLAFADWNDNQNLHTFYIIAGEFARYCLNVEETPAQANSQPK